MKSGLIILALISCFHLAELQRRNVCYWGTWAFYRSGQGAFSIAHIDPTICTHIIYAFMGATEYGEVHYLDPHLDIEMDYVNRFTSLRHTFPNTKYFFSIGGYTHESEIFSIIAASPVLRTTFAQNVLDMINIHNFDGMDLDWEYPAQRGGDPDNDKENFVLLCAELYRVLSAAGKEFGIAVAAAEFSASISYDVPRLSPVVDFINIMTYDFHGTWNNFTGIHGAMFSSAADTSAFSRQLNVNASVHWWISQGASRSKINVGMPAYGRVWTLDNPNVNNVGASAHNAGLPGPFLNESGFHGYNEICINLSFNGWSRRWESNAHVPYAVQGSQWIGYDDLQSISGKLDFIIRENLGGAMWWSIDTEDFRNMCGQGFSPLVRLAMNRMRN